ncbi:MAG: ATPase, T2SS/T4P/T4SS family [Kiritimatiellaeota bacterium]|nr:ATPase, T2SS/T4P/T4SS family [Kiritimatiellota bacterium]
METESSSSKLYEIFLRRNAAKPEVLLEARKDAEATGSRFEKVLAEKNLVSASHMVLALSEYLNMPPVALGHFTPDPQLLDLAPREVLTRHHMLPLHRCGRLLTVAMGDPFDVIGLVTVHDLSGLEVVPVVAPDREITDLLQRFTREPTQGLEDILRDVAESDVEFGLERKEDISLEEMLESAEDAPVIRIVNSIMVEGLRKRASDIHIEPMEKIVRLRYRIDGMLCENPSPPKHLQAAITSRIKIMSNLNIAERRVPQDGRFKIKAVGKEVDIRVSILPTVHGEKIVMRILDKSSLAPNLDALQLDPKSLANLRYAIAQPHGMILVTGPTGSGKTTTLYSALQELNQPDVNIITVEDPVEYQLPGINQVQAHAEIGLTFAAGLRSILRQDPDIVLIGEIRDGETAAIAVQAALTGHLVLSTLHTNDAAGAIARMVYMGIEPFLLASSLLMTQAQRLYRKLCPACKQERAMPSELLLANHLDADKFRGLALFQPRGCPKCNDTGFRGRAALMEILLADDSIRDLILKNANTGAVAEQAVKNGMTTLREVGLQRVREGITNFEEILRVTTAD